MSALTTMSLDDFIGTAARRDLHSVTIGMHLGEVPPNYYKLQFKPGMETGVPTVYVGTESSENEETDKFTPKPLIDLTKAVRKITGGVIGINSASNAVHKASRLGDSVTRILFTEIYLTDFGKVFRPDLTKVFLEEVITTHPYLALFDAINRSDLNGHWKKYYGPVLGTNPNQLERDRAIEIGDVARWDRKFAELNSTEVLSLPRALEVWRPIVAGALVRMGVETVPPAIQITPTSIVRVMTMLQRTYSMRNVVVRDVSFKS